MRSKLFVAIITLSLCSTCFGYIVDGSRINRPRMLSYAQSKLQNHGTVEQTSVGSTYLKVPDAYIKELFKQIQMPGYEMPNKSQISIINEREAKGISSLHELGQTVQFKPLGFYTIMEDNLEYFMLAVDAPELSTIRTKYGLSEKLENHAFTIIIAVREVKAHDELGKQH
jgi:hypothetical protein